MINFCKRRFFYMSREIDENANLERMGCVVLAGLAGATLLSSFAGCAIARNHELNKHFDQEFHRLYTKEMELAKQETQNANFGEMITFTRTGTDAEQIARIGAIEARKKLKEDTQKLETNMFAGGAMGTLPGFVIPPLAFFTVPAGVIAASNIGLSEQEVENAHKVIGAGVNGAKKGVGGLLIALGAIFLSSSIKSRIRENHEEESKQS
jgi:hypothetical protein